MLRMEKYTWHKITITMARKAHPRPHPLSLPLIPAFPSSRHILHTAPQGQSFLFTGFYVLWPSISPSKMILNGNTNTFENPNTARTVFTRRRADRLPCHPARFSGSLRSTSNVTLRKMCTVGDDSWRPIDPATFRAALPLLFPPALQEVPGLWLEGVRKAFTLICSQPAGEGRTEEALVRE